MPDAEPQQPSQSIAGVFAPALGLQPRPVPIAIEDGLEIDHMTEAELKETERWGIGGGMQEPRYAIRFNRPYVERGGPDSIESATERGTIENRGVRAIELVVWALRLFKQGSVSVPYIIGGPPFDEAAGHAIPREQPQNMVVVYDILSTEEASAFVTFLTSSVDGLTASPLDYSLRRFNQAVTKQNPEDRLVDLMIACEALLLPDAGGELRYRMALRSAFALDGSGHSRRELFDLMKAAYDVRSWIVHGKTDRTPRLPSREKVDLIGLTGFTNLLEDLVRKALRGAVISAQEGKWPPDWDAMILGAGSASPTQI